MAVKSFRVGIQSKPSRATRWQYDFATSHKTLENGFKGYDPEDWTRFQVLEDFDYPAPFTSQEHSRWLAIKALERLHADARFARAPATSRCCSAGTCSTLKTIWCGNGIPPGCCWTSSTEAANHR